MSKAAIFNNAPRLKRALMVMGIFSLLLASSLELYTFGVTPDFLTRWSRTFFVLLVLISVTVLGIIPAANRLFR